MIRLYGIRNCDTVKRARAWLEERGIAYQFHDFKRDGLELSQVRTWAVELGWESLLNRRGTTWRRLPESRRANLDEERAIELMAEHPSLIRRPLLDTGQIRHLGFSETDYQRLLG
ncbi:ArsC family reductase [Thiocapsa imhoffii]|uniref:ArsC family reductase n=1 Tax=Thiocapsa imhoffii TaxID=382777 RepID=A0A9X0WGW2_9GAMM|nr:ArsC family reductase [Thiocapsa imhoffii]MBK1644363.1 ArsC family reductase [Thiocapsa imhoffii]